MSADSSPLGLSRRTVTVKCMVDPQDLIVQIRAAFRAGQYEVSRHAVVRMLRRVIHSSEIEEAIAGAEIIETYPDDKYGSSILLLGLTRAGRPLHIQVAYERMRIVTVYEPDPTEWLDGRYRRRSDHGG